jgi:thiamine pyrophosphate-dependent acetolactate synthase large subunit-like protein
VPDAGAGQPPAEVAAWRARLAPGHRVAEVVGDGAFAMTGMELLAAARLELELVALRRIGMDLRG